MNTRTQSPCPNVEKCPHMADAAEKAADHAVAKVFAILGVDINRPDSVEEFREDLRFGKKMRRMADHGQLAMVGVFVLGISWAIWEGIKAKLGG